MSDWRKDLGRLLQLAGQSEAAEPWLASDQFEDAYEPRAVQRWTPSGDFTWQLTLANDYVLTGNQLWDLPECSPVDLPLKRGWLRGEDSMVAYTGSHWQLWDLSRQRPQRRFAMPPDVNYLSEVWAVDDYLAVWQHKQILFFNLRDGSLAWQIKGYKILGQVPERQAVVISRFKTESGLYRLSDGAELARLPEGLTAFAADQQGYLVGQARADWSYHSWDDGRVLSSAQDGPKSYAEWLHLPGNGQVLMSGDGITRWSLQDGRRLQDFGARLRTHSGQNLTLSRDGRLILAVCVEGLAVYASATGQLLQFFRSGNEGHCRVEVSPDDRWLVCCLGNEVHFYERIRRNKPGGRPERLLADHWDSVRPYRSQCVFYLSRRHPQLRPLSQGCQPYRDHREWIWAAVCQREWQRLAHYPPGRVWPTLLQCPDDAPLLQLLEQPLPLAWCQDLALRLVLEKRPGLVPGLRRHRWPDAWLPLLDWLEDQPCADLRPLLQELGTSRAEPLRQRLIERHQLSLINRADSAEIGHFSAEDWNELLARLQPEQLRPLLARLPLRRSLPLLQRWPGPWSQLLQSALAALQPELLAEPDSNGRDDQALLCPGRADFGWRGKRQTRLFYERQWRNWPELLGLAADPRGSGVVLATRQRLEYWSSDLTRKLWSRPIQFPADSVEIVFPPNHWIVLLCSRSHDERAVALYRRDDGKPGWSCQLTHSDRDVQVDERGLFFEYGWLDWRDGERRPIPDRNSYWTLRGQPTHLYVRNQACSPTGNWWVAASPYGEMVLSTGASRPMRYYTGPHATGNVSLLVDDRHSLVGCNGDFWEAESGERLLSLRESWLHQFAYEGRRSRLIVSSYRSIWVWRLIDPRPLPHISAQEIEERLNQAYAADEQALWTIAAQLREELP